MADKKDASKDTAPKGEVFDAKTHKPRLILGAWVGVNDIPGKVTGIAFDEFEGMPIRWIYRVGAGWYTLDQLEVK